MKFKTILCCILINSFTFAKVIIWDFGGITFNPNKWGVAMNIGIHHFIFYAIADFQNPNIQKMLFEFLEEIKRESGKDKYLSAGTAEGMPLPPIMCDWQSGKISGPEIIKKAKENIKELGKLGYFRSNREKILVEKTISAMFDPKTLAKNVYPVKQGIDLLKECALAKNPDGSRKNLNIAFSNWDPLSFDIFYKLNKDSFKYFDEIVVSGHIGLIKPDKDAYEYILRKFNLNPRDCILIDDQEVNAQGAKKCGIKTILLKNWNYKDLTLQLKMHGVL